MKNDTQLQQDVMAELKWEPAINAEQIGVEVKYGVVTLAGHVGSYGEKWDAERAAQRVAGVRALAIEIDVKLAGSAQRTDADVARAAENVLEWTTYVPKDAVKVMVEAGWITLSGDVDWGFQREAAGAAVRYLMGVKGVSNDIGIRASVTPAAVRSDIEAALKRRAHADATNIAVDVQGANVTLSGSVHSWSERDLARDSAWGTPGVRQVVDNLSIKQ